MLSNKKNVSYQTNITLWSYHMLTSNEFDKMIPYLSYKSLPIIVNL